MRQGRQGLLRVLALAFACLAIASAAAFGQEHEGGQPEDEAGDDPIANRGDRYVPEPPGTVKKMRFWYGPYVMPAGWDANRVDLDIPVHNGMILQVEPELRVNPDWEVPSHQVAHIHHAHWFALDPGNQEDNYTGGNTEWIFGNGDEETQGRLHAALERAEEGPLLRRVHRARRAAGDDLHAAQQDRADDGRLRRAQRYVQVRHDGAVERHRSRAQGPLGSPVRAHVRRPAPGQGRRLVEHDEGHAHGGRQAAPDRVDLDRSTAP